MENLVDVVFIAPYQAKIAKIVYEQILEDEKEEDAEDAVDNVASLSGILCITNEEWCEIHNRYEKVSNAMLEARVPIEELLEFEQRHMEKMKEFYLSVCAPVLDARN